VSDLVKGAREEILSIEDPVRAHRGRRRRKIERLGSASLEAGPERSEEAGLEDAFDIPDVVQHGGGFCHDGSDLPSPGATRTAREPRTPDERPELLPRDGDPAQLGEP